MSRRRLKPAVQLTPSGLCFNSSESPWISLRLRFEKHSWIKLPSFLAPALLENIQRCLRTTRFDKRIHPGVALELCMKDKPLRNRLLFLANDPRLFEWIRGVTRCGKIGGFIGRVYRMDSHSGHHDDWHSDVTKPNRRLVGMSVNLSEKVYRGGTLWIRDALSKKVLEKVINVGPGDCILFRISPRLHHCITDVKGPYPKTAFAGWFQTGAIFSEGSSRLAVPPLQTARTHRIGLDDTIQIDTLCRKRGKGVLVLHPARGHVYRLDSVADFIWSGISQNGNLNQVYSNVLAYYRVSPDVLLNDFLNFINDLAKRGLISVKE